ncbi:MAG: hypothetical protein Q4C47_08995, partial [Planctomycetia bacterium]|nr:hypothetical protein [Planctomycetia bacterium]
MSDGSEVTGRRPEDPVFLVCPESPEGTSWTDRRPGWRRVAISIGNFDGVHLGHRRLIRRLREVSRHLTETGDIREGWDSGSGAGSGDERCGG